MLRSPRNDAGIAKLALVLGLAGAVVVGAGGAYLVTGSSSPVSQAIGASGPQPTPAPTPGIVVAGSDGDTVPWSSPLTFTVSHATILSLTAATTTGIALPGSLTTPSEWVSSSRLVPSTGYRLTGTIQDAKGKTQAIDQVVQASAATQILRATVSPGGGGTYGIGQPVIVRFNQKIKGVAARTAVLARLHVTTSPVVDGAWRWYSSYEVHYRGQEYWPSGATVKVTASFAGLNVPGTEIWGDPGSVTRSFAVDRALIATVDVATHKMTVTRDGTVIRIINVSTGRDKYPTKGGVHIVLTRETSAVYDSSTVGIPTASPDGYYETLPWSMRISNGGAFVHANPATVKVQGIANVSHGCVNTSVEDAHWFYDNTHLGDIVNIVHAEVPPVASDAGMYDWYFTWDQWRLGNLNG